ncbi:hypothetical protein CBL_10796 [Carabus blaptoides fortunei]
MQLQLAKILLQMHIQVSFCEFAHRAATHACKTSKCRAMLLLLHCRHSESVKKTKSKAYVNVNRVPQNALDSTVRVGCYEVGKLGSVFFRLTVIAVQIHHLDSESDRHIYLLVGSNQRTFICMATAASTRTSGGVERVSSAQSTCLFGCLLFVSAVVRCGNVAADDMKYGNGREPVSVPYPAQILD